MSQHFSFSKKEYRQKLMKLLSGVFFAALALALAIWLALQEPFRTAESTIFFIISGLIAAMLFIALVPRIRSYSEVHVRRRSIRELHCLVNRYYAALGNVGLEGGVLPVYGQQYTFDPIDRGTISLHSKWFGHFGISTTSVTSLCDKQITTLRDVQEIIANLNVNLGGIGIDMRPDGSDEEPDLCDGEDLDPYFKPA